MVAYKDHLPGAVDDGGYEDLPGRANPRRSDSDCVVIVGHEGIFLEELLQLVNSSHKDIFL